MSEEWRNVVGYEGLYEVSDLGRVKSLERRCASRGGGQREVLERILKQRVDGRGHLTVGLWICGEQKTRTVHRLVLEAFVSPCPEGMEGCHNDGNPANNRADNLRWDTPRANMDDRIRHGAQAKGERAGGAKLTEANVREIRERLAAGDSQREIAKRFGVGQARVSDIRTGKCWRHVSPIA